MSDADDRLVTLCWVFRPAHLLVVQSLLIQADILHYLVGYHHLTNQWVQTLALGGVEVRIPAAQAEDAFALFTVLPPLDPPPRPGFGRIVLLLFALLFCLAAPPGLSTEPIALRRERQA